MPPLALVGNLSRDVVDGGPPRIGGAPYYAARAWRVLGSRGTIFTRSGPEDRVAYTRHLTGLGLPVVSLEGTTTTSFSFHYEGDTRIMTVEQAATVAVGAGRHRAVWMVVRLIGLLIAMLLLPVLIVLNLLLYLMILPAAVQAIIG